MKGFIKKGLMAAVMAMMMGTVVFASGSVSHTTPIEIIPAINWYSDAHVFEDGASHVEKCAFYKIENKGKCFPRIAKQVFGVKSIMLYSEVTVAKGVEGIEYSIDWGEISGGKRYYGFGGNETSRYFVKYYSDTWS